MAERSNSGDYQMSPEAQIIKDETIARYKYCVKDKVLGFDDRLREAELQPNEFWENQVKTHNS